MYFHLIIVLFLLSSNNSCLVGCVGSSLALQSHTPDSSSDGFQSNLFDVERQPHAEARTSLSTQKFLSQTPSILYTAVVRGKVALPCDITPPTLDDQVVLILWYKDEQLAPIYTLDARRGNLEQARTLTSALLDGRAYFNLHNRPAFLQIDPIRLMDAGDYRCRVDFKKARTVNTVISLKVIVPPEEPIITDTDGNELKGLIGPFNEADQLKLICTTNGGKPRPSLTWWRDYSIIDDTFEYNEKDVTTNQLTISTLARHHLLSIFTCQAINNNITVPSSTSITLDLNLKPTEVRITQLTPILVADREAIFECNTFGSRPKATLFWLFQGSRIDTKLNGEHQTSTTLTVTLKHAHNGAILTCIAENNKIVDSGLSDQLKLDVQYIPQLTLELGTAITPTISLQNIQEGNDIYFDCHIDANPRPNAPILWRFNGNVLHPQQGIIQSNVSLVLQKVNRSQSGTYQCEASNQQGIALSNAIHLKIRYAPVCQTDLTLAFGVSPHESVELRCDVEANPPDVSFQWTFEKNIELSNFVKLDNSSSVLIYSPHTPQDYGTVECMAKNSIGLQQKACKYQIIEASPPNFPFKCYVANRTDNALMISCEDQISIMSSNWTANDVRFENNDNNNDYKKFGSNSQTIVVYPPTFYVCEVYTTTDQNLAANVSMAATVPLSHISTNSLLSDSTNILLDNNINSVNPSTTKNLVQNFQIFVPNLTPNTNFSLKVFATNSKGRSKPFSLRAQTHRPAEKLVDPNSGGSSLLSNGNSLLARRPMEMALLIGAGVVTIIVMALGIIAVIRVRTSSTVSRQPSLQENRQQQNPSSAMIFEEEECEQCCDDDCCDEMLLTTQTQPTQTQTQQQLLQNSAPNKGPPDIIPSFGYLSTGLDKNYISYAYSTEQSIEYVPQNESALHYAELSFCGQPIASHPSLSAMSKSGQQSVEYAKIEFAKSQTPIQRVNLIGGSPKYESTV